MDPCSGTKIFEKVKVHLETKLQAANGIKKSCIMVIPTEQLHPKTSGFRFTFYACSNSSSYASETWSEEKVLQGFRLYVRLTTFSPFNHSEKFLKKIY